MKKVAAAACVLLAFGCVTPQVRFHDAAGTREGYIIAALPMMPVTISETRSGSDITLKAQAGVIEDSSVFISLEPHRGLWSETRLAPTYWENTSVMQKMTVQTVDRRLATAQALQSIARVITGGLALDGRSAPACVQVSIPARTLTAVMADDATYDTNVLLNDTQRRHDQAQVEHIGRMRAASAAERARMSAPEPVRCHAKLEFGPVPQDAITVAAFRETYVNGGGDRYRFVPYAACHRVTVEITNRLLTAAGDDGARAESFLYLPDPNYVRVARLPYQANMDFTRTCSPPSITDAKEPEKTDLQVLSEILNLFKDDKKK